MYNNLIENTTHHNTNTFWLIYRYRTESTRKKWNTPKTLRDYSHITP